MASPKSAELANGVADGGASVKKSKAPSGPSPADFFVTPPIDGKYRTGLYVNNSMAGGKVEFIPIAGNGSRRVTWYGCGPTVYDAAHMGHARTYVAFDIIRRIMNDYFGYDVHMCMNVTDIDDKIIARSAEKKVEFTALARYWECAFWDDMRRLNVLYPDVITRVSEYIPEVLTFIEKIVERGFAYESQGSVYFSTEAFRASPSHIYGRMEPFSVNDEGRVLEGEGSLGIVTEKKSPLDFALWKKAKEGEPSWPSPWGPGRPGWHIECSAMACAVLGFPIDIHSGGIDLRFPHHDNELAQSEACYDKPQWVNYFLHAGHLHIQGMKMAKSLKNFITIKEALELFSARAIRLLTLMHRWDTPMNYSPDGEAMSHAVDTDKVFSNFFGLISATLRDALDLSKTTEALKDAKSLDNISLGGLLGEQKWKENEEILLSKLNLTQQQVHSALSDNFDTPTAILSLRTLVSEVHTYLRSAGKAVKGPLVIKAARFVFKMLRIFGVTNGDEAELNYLGTSSSSEVETGVMDCLSNFRHEVRKTSQALLKATKPAAEVDLKAISGQIKCLLSACDVVRDSGLTKVGIQLMDTPDGPVWSKIET